MSTATSFPVDESLLSEMGDLVPLEPLLKRLRTLQHDHITEKPDIEREIERSQSTLIETILELPDDRCARYLRAYSDLRWAATMMLWSVADAEMRGKLAPELLGL